MKKNIALIIGILLLSIACKRRPGQVPTHGNIEWRESGITASVSEHLDASTDFEAPVFTPLEKKKDLAQPARKHVRKPVQLRIPKTKAMKKAEAKELPQGLANALWITFIGLGGMILCAVLLLAFDTTFLLALFGLVFLVGIISLIMYKATHRKKIKA